MRYIIIDGLDGVGKDTHALLVKEKYEKIGEKVVIRSHPNSDNFFGRVAKKSLLGGSKFDKIKAAVFYMLDVLRSVRKYSNRSDIDTLIMVRYLVGTAYLPERLSKFMYKFFLGFVPTSKYMFFLDADPKLVLKRFEERSELEVFETLSSLKKVRKKALFLVKNWYVINTAGSIKDTFSEIEKILDLIDEEK